MMKKLAAAFVVLSLAVLPAAVACDKDHGTATQSAEFGKGPVKDVVLTGYLTDSNCGAANAHAGGADCAKKCIKNGGPVGIGGDGKAYLVVGAHKPMNDELAPLAGKTVTLKGKMASNGGISMLENAEIVKK